MGTLRRQELLAIDDRPGPESSGARGGTFAPPAGDSDGRCRIYFFCLLVSISSPSHILPVAREGEDGLRTIK